MYCFYMVTDTLNPKILPTAKLYGFTLCSVDNHISVLIAPVEVLLMGT
jgi:hypothetical protein